MTSIGELIINSVTTAAAIRDVRRMDNGSMVFVWEANAPEQIEAAIREPMLERLRALLRDDEVIKDALAMFTVARAKGDDPITMMRFVMADFAFKVLGAEPDQQKDEN